jgi:hypothetical protein
VPSKREIEAGRAFVRLFLKNDMAPQLAKALKSAGRSMTTAGAAVTAAGTAMVAPIVAAMKTFADTGDALDKMSARLGATVPFLSALSHAATIGGTDINALEVGIRRMQRTAYDAQRGLSTAVDAFDDLGISAVDSSGKLKGTEQLFMESVIALSKVENETKKAALATVIFGRAGTQLLPMLRDGKDGLVEVMREAERLGYVLSKKDATAAAELTDAMARLKSTLRVTWIRVGAAVSDIITDLANRLAEAGPKVIDFVKTHKALIQTLLKVGAAVVAAGAALTALGATSWAMGVGIAAAVTSVKALAVALGFLIAHPAIAALTVMGALAIALGRALDQTSKYTADLSDGMSKLRQKGDELRATDAALFERLDNLATVQELTSKEMEEANTIIETLSQRYGDLGVSIDKATGRLTKMTEAQKAATREQMKADAEAQILRELAENRRAQQDIGKEMQTRGYNWLAGKVYGEDPRIAELDRIAKQKQREHAALIGRLRKLRAGDAGAVTGGAAAGGTGQDAAGATAAAVAFNKRMIDEIASLRIAAIEDEYRRSVALLDRRYEKEKSQARELGGNALALAEAAHKQAMQNLEREAARRKALAKQAQAEERAMRDRDFDELLRQQEESQEAIKGDIESQIARLRIETGGGTAAEKQQQLLNLEHAQALSDAAAQGLGLGDQERINELYALKRKGARQQAVSAGPTLTAGGPEQKMADGIVAIERNTAEMTRQQQEFLAGWRVV